MKFDTSPPPRPVKSLNKKLIWTIIRGSAVVLGLGLGLVIGSSGSDNEKAQNSGEPIEYAAPSHRSGEPGFIQDLLRERSEPEHYEFGAGAEETAERSKPFLEKAGMQKSDLDHLKEEESRRELQDDIAAKRANPFFQDSPVARVEPRRNDSDFNGYAPPATSGIVSGPKDRHQERADFIKGKGGHPYVVAEADDHTIMEGTLISGVLVSAINTELPGPILAQVSENVFDTKTGDNLLIPQGSKLVGEYNSTVSDGQIRAQMVWNKVILPDTRTIELDRMVGLDGAGKSGSEGSVDNHWGKMFLSASLSSLMNLGSISAPSEEASLAQKLLGGAGKTAYSVADKVVEKGMDVPPTIEVKAGTKLRIFVKKRIVMPIS